MEREKTRTTDETSDLPCLGIDAYLPDGYLQPYGTPLTPAHFVPFGEGLGWHVTARDCTGTPLRYTIRLTGRKSHQATVEADGERILCRDVNSKKTTNRTTVAAWYDWILWQDANAHAGQSQPEWRGDGLPEMMHRLESHVSTYSTHEENLNNFITVGGLQAWLADALASSPVQVTAFTVKPPPGKPATLHWWEDLRWCFLSHRHWHEPEGLRIDNSIPEGDATTTQCSAVFNPRVSFTDWYHQPRVVVTPTVHLLVDGARIRAYCAEDFLPLADLNQAAALDKQPTHRLNDWSGLIVKGADVALVFPSRGTNLAVHTDDDGSTVFITAYDTDDRTVENADRERFNRAWGKWLDPDSTLTQAELNEGIARAESMIGESR